MVLTHGTAHPLSGDQIEGIDLGTLTAAVPWLATALAVVVVVALVLRVLRANGVRLGVNINMSVGGDEQPRSSPGGDCAASGGPSPSGESSSPGRDVPAPAAQHRS